MKPTFSNFRITVWCIDENMDFGPKPSILALSFMNGQTLAKAGKVQEGPKVWRHLPHLKGADFEWPQRGLGEQSGVLRSAGFLEKLEIQIFMGNFPVLKCWQRIPLFCTGPKHCVDQ